MPILLLLLFAAACGGSSAGSPGTTVPNAPDAPARAPLPVLVGELTRERIEAEVPGWAEARDASPIDQAAAQALASVPTESELVVYLGTWCGDSKREVSRFFRALDVAGTVPFRIRYVGVDRAKQAPDLPDGLDLRFVPTFVVLRNGLEMGRLVESAPNGIEVDVGRLLRGEETGVISGRADALEL